MPHSKPEDIAAIAEDMAEDIRDNNGLREGVNFLHEGPSEPYSRTITERNNSDNYVSPSPYFIPTKYQKAKPAVPVVVESRKPAPIVKTVTPVSTPTSTHTPSFGMAQRQLVL